MSERISDEGFQTISDYVDALKTDGWEQGIGMNEYIEMRDALKAEREYAKQQDARVAASRHDPKCKYWVWDWQHSWAETDCTCTEKAEGF